LVKGGDKITEKRIRPGLETPRGKGKKMFIRGIPTEQWRKKRWGGKTRMFWLRAKNKFRPGELN